MKIVDGQQSYSARANWKLLVENSYDGYHGMPTHQRYFSFLSDIGVDMKGSNVASPSHQHALDLGNGHAVLEYKSAWGRPLAHCAPPFGEHRKQHFEQLRRRFDDRLPPNLPRRICHPPRNPALFPTPLTHDLIPPT